MSNRINLWWWIDFPGNLGDQITPFIVEQIWGKVNYVESWRRHKLVGAGSTRLLSGRVSWSSWSFNPENLSSSKSYWRPRTTCTFMLSSYC